MKPMRLPQMVRAPGLKAAWALGFLAEAALAQAPAPAAPAASAPVPAATPASPPAGAVVYRCPGPPVLYTDALSPQDARERGCRSIEGVPISIVPGPRPRPQPAASGGTPPLLAAPGLAPGAAPRAGLPEARVDPNAQRQRDRDARRVLEDELKREEDKLAGLKREFNNGEPERRGEERNYQQYLDRVSALRASIARSEADVAALKRELAKLPS